MGPKIMDIWNFVMKIMFVIMSMKVRFSIVSIVLLTVTSVHFRVAWFE